MLFSGLCIRTKARKTPVLGGGGSIGTADPWPQRRQRCWLSGRAYATARALHCSKLPLPGPRPHKPPPRSDLGRPSGLGLEVLDKGPRSRRHQVHSSIEQSSAAFCWRLRFTERSGARSVVQEMRSHLRVTLSPGACRLAELVELRGGRVCAMEL
jgi:hypothetical protein